MPCRPKPRSVRRSVPFGRQRRGCSLDHHHRDTKSVLAITAWRNGYKWVPLRFEFERADLGSANGSTVFDAVRAEN